jgi:DnaJ-class molecular chaperone
VFRLSGLGMPQLQQPDKRGALYVTAEALLPDQLSAQEQELFEQLRSLHERG